jgi:hypothetical protein
MSDSRLFLPRSYLSRSPEYHLPMRVAVIRIKPPEEEIAAFTSAGTEPAQDPSIEFGELRSERLSWRFCSVVTLASKLLIS